MYPSRPPSELVCSFCFICGGFMLMASVRLSAPLAISRVKNQSDVEMSQNRDTVQSMIDNGVNTMVVTTVAMGITATLMAWVIFLLMVKGWAEKREEKREEKWRDRLVSVQ